MEPWMEAWEASRLLVGYTGMIILRSAKPLVFNVTDVVAYRIDLLAIGVMDCNNAPITELLLKGGVAVDLSPVAEQITADMQEHGILMRAIQNRG